MKYYYRCSRTTDLWKEFRKVMNRCFKADQAQVTFQEHVGAVAFCPNDAMFAGGVEGVFFEDDAKVDRRLWQEAGKSDDGSICWVPICQRRTGKLTLPKGAARPADTAYRIYGPVVVDERGRTTCKYIELYRKVSAEERRRKEGKMPLFARKSIRIERARMKLPVVPVMDVLNLLGADLSGGKDGCRMHLVRPVTPTFFEYWQHIYIGCAYPCKAEGLEEIASGAYAEAERALREVEREKEEETRR